MARVRKCDRCGAVYTPYVNKEFNAVGTVTFNMDDEEIDTGEYKDLCPKCNTEFKAWLDAYKGKSNTASIDWEDDIK